MIHNFYKISMKIGHIFCHQKPERSFFYKNYQFPLCARCVGITIGFLITLILLFFKYYIDFWLSLFLTAIMFLDWLIQFLNIKQSTNIRRLITGIIGGFGISYFYYFIIIFFISFIH